jgi:glycosyltransferase involved in cell wall biosynthesis
MNILMTLANPFTHDPRVYNEAKSLVNSGHNVTVIAWDKTKKNPKRETKDGIQIIRSYNSKFMDILNYDLFQLHWWWIKGYKDALHLFQLKKFDIVHCHDLSSLPIGIKIKKRFGIPLIYDAHEIFWYMISDDVPKFVMRYTFYLEKILCKKVDYIITVNKPVKYYFSRICNCPIHIVMNAKPCIYERYALPENDIFTILYLGGIDRTRHLLEVVEAVGSLKDVKLILGGSSHDSKYYEKLINKCDEMDNCNFIGRIPMNEVIPMTRKSDVIIHLGSAKSEKSKWPIKIDLPSRFGLPNKLFESMVAGRPIIVPKNTYEAEFVKKIQNGIAIDLSVNNIKNVLNLLKNNPELCEKMGRKGFLAAIEKYNWKKQEEKILNIYSNLKK